MSFHLQREIEKLKKLIFALGAHTEQALRDVAIAASQKKADLAKSIIENDKFIDSMEVEIEEECLKILALYQPVAIDLRFLVATLKINSEFERIGDLAANIAKKTLHLTNYPGSIPDVDFEPMARTVQTMLNDCIDALVNLNFETATTILKTDDIVDRMNSQMYKELKEKMKSSPELLDPLINLLSISKGFERIADCATNVAEDIIYMIDGKIVRHQSAEDIVN